MKFCGTTTCDECPWRTDVPVGRFPRKRFEQLRHTAEQGLGNPIFACHKTAEGQEQACVGFLLVEGQNNIWVRIFAARGAFDPKALKATGPLYESYDQMARANGVRKRTRR